MSKRRKWYSPISRLGYCEELGGVVYLRYGRTFQKSTGLTWIPANKSKAVQMLEYCTTAISLGVMSSNASVLIAAVKANMPREKIDEILQRLIEGETPDRIIATKALPTAYTVKQCIDDYMKVHLEEKSPSLRSNFMQASKKFLPEAIRNTHITFELIYDAVQASVGRLRSELAPSSLNGYIERMNAWCGYLVRRRILKDNPIKAVTRSKGTMKSEPEAFTQEEVAKIIEAYQNSRHRKRADLILFLALTGLRINEALALTWDDIDDEVIHVQYSSPKRDRRPKSGRSRQFPYKSEIFKQVAEIIDRARAQRTDRSNYVFRAISYDKVRFHFNRMLVAAGVPVKENRSLHGLRRTAIAWWESIGLSFEMRCQLAGHSLSVQAKVYRQQVKWRELVDRVDKDVNRLGKVGVGSE